MDNVYVFTGPENGVEEAGSVEAAMKALTQEDVSQKPIENDKSRRLMDCDIDLGRI